MYSLQEKAALAVTYFEALQANTNNTKQFAIEKLGYSENESEAIVKVWCDCFVELSKKYEWKQIITLSQETITYEELKKAAKKNSSVVKAFLNDWKIELHATKRVQKLSEDLDYADRMEKPRDRIFNSLQHWKSKQSEINTVIIEKTKQGIYTDNTLYEALKTSKNDKLGYVVICFSAMLEDYR